MAEQIAELDKLRKAVKASEMDAETLEQVYGSETQRRDGAEHLAEKYGIPSELLAGHVSYADMKAVAVKFQQAVDTRLALRLKETPATVPTAAQERSLSGNLPIPTAQSQDEGSYIKSVADGGTWDAAKSAAILKRMGLG